MPAVRLPAISPAAMLIAVVFLLTTAGVTMAQNGQNGQNNGQFINITVSAQIQTTVDIETRANINLGRVSPGQESITVNPREDPGAGVLRVSGSPGMLFRVSFQEQRELIRVGGGGLSAGLSLRRERRPDRKSISFRTHYPGKPRSADE